MITAAIRSTVLAERHRGLGRKEALYKSNLSRQDIEAIQVKRFNETWGFCLAQVPFYRTWHRLHKLPSQIKTPTDLAAFPPLRKSAIIENSECRFSDTRIAGYYTTGGSTGQPTRFPRGKGELDENWINSYTGRSWSGVAPLEPTVHLWGHSHLFGGGVRGKMAQARRYLADQASGITRLNAYDLSESALARNYAALKRCDPVVISGYTSAVFRLARYIDRNDLHLPATRRLRAVILCAETAGDADIDLIERVFGGRIVIEYGAAETGVIAMSNASTRDIRVLWDSVICLVLDDGDLRVTTIGPRVFPLINYAIGDRVSATNSIDGNALAFSAVLGRRQDVVKMMESGGRLEVSAIMPVHILKAYPGIVGVQFKQLRPDLLRIFVEADVRVEADAIHAFFIRELRRDHPQLLADSVEIEIVASQSRTRAGKHALFID